MRARLATLELDRGSAQGEQASAPVRLPRRPMGTLHLAVAGSRQALSATVRRLQGASPEQLARSRGVEWLLDNDFLVQRAAQQVAQELTPTFEARLPVFQDGPAADQARALAVCRQLFADTEGPVTREVAAAAIRSLQERTALTMAEIWALPLLLRLVAIEILAISAGRLLLEEGPGPDEARPDQQVASCIQTLRAIEVTDWKRFFEDLSLTEEALRADPAGVYPKMDFATRDAWRKQIERLAQGSRIAEEEVAQAVVDLAAEGQGIARHVGYHLVGKGLERLERKLGCRRGPRLRLERFLRRWPTVHYLGAIGTGTVVLEVGLWWLLHPTPAVALAASLLALPPLLSVAVGLVNWAVTRLLPPSLLPKLDFSEGITPECRTLVVVPCLLTGSEEIDALLAQLELHHLANPDPRLRFALVTDFTDSLSEHKPTDDALIARASAGIQALEARHGGIEGGRFHLLHRRREFNPAQGCWMGWERKRGKLEDLNALLRGAPRQGIWTMVGHSAALEGTRFVLTLDADTQLPRGAARRLVGTLAHPLNRAVFDPASGKVTAGYTLLQPRVEVTPGSETMSVFARVFTGIRGLDPYARAVSDVHQDLFGEGIYVGKGIYDVEAFEQSLRGVVPENSVLSHDLFEGSHGRAALVSDVVVLEDYPTSYLTWARRLHRWVRGDWQLLPWLGLRPRGADGRRHLSRLSWMARWRIFDNLRRSVEPPSIVLFLIFSWVALPAPTLPLTIAVLMVPVMPAIPDLLSRTLGWTWLASIRGIGFFLSFASLARKLGRLLLGVAFLPHEAQVLADAILRTLLRMGFTRRLLLEWTTAAHTARQMGRNGGLLLHLREMAICPIAAVGMGSLLTAFRPIALLAAAPVLVLWAAGPLLAAWSSRPRPTLAEPPSTVPADHRALRQVARRTWLFFQTFVGPHDHWLPPDHFQEDPLGLPVHRTSPTNIGLLLASTIAAWELGDVDTRDAVFRVRNTLRTLVGMQRYRGHVLNWIATDTLAELHPRYVSTVDSGNLAACLLLVAETSRAFARAIALPPARMEGLRDDLTLLDDAIEELISLGVEAAPLQQGRRALARSARLLEPPPRDAAGRLQAVERLRAEASPQAEELVGRALGMAELAGLEPVVLERATRALHLFQHGLDAIHREAEQLAPWLLHLPQTESGLPVEAATAWSLIRRCLAEPPTLAETPSICEQLSVALVALVAALSAREVREDALIAWAGALAEACEVARGHARLVLHGVAETEELARRLFDEMDFSFLYDPDRRLLRIGVDLDADQPDPNHYDLLASEARLTSLLAIAKGDLPEEHWLHLGRPLGQTRQGRTLLSWSGSMFEYLMPGLLLWEPRDTLLGQSDRAAVRAQRGHARKRKVPWGISESAYFHKDAGQTYQYRAFGVPELGFKRGLADDLVIAPYASMLALPICPRAVLRNLLRLRALGAMGPFGLYEALDFTPSRLPPGQAHAVVHTYMAHHQGMILVSLANHLCDGVLVRRFQADRAIQTVQVLLFERASGAGLVERQASQPLELRANATARVHLGSWAPPSQPPVPWVHPLSNGRLSAWIDTDGGGSLRWEDLVLTAPLSPGGSGGFRWWIRAAGSELRLPLDGGVLGRTVRLHPHGVDIRTSQDGVSVRERIFVAAEADVELRWLRLAGEGRKSRRVELTSYVEVVLGSATAFRRHPAFHKLFVEAEYHPELHALLLHRRSREPDDQGPWLLQMLVGLGAGVMATGHSASREACLGRHGSHASTPTGRGGAQTGPVLDPALSLSVEVVVEPGEAQELALVTLVGRDRAEALALARRYRSTGRLRAALDGARDRVRVELRTVGLDPGELPVAHGLLSLVLTPTPAARAPAELLAKNRLGQPGLWRFGISGDLPLLLIRYREPEDIAVIEHVLRAHAWWRGRGVPVDLVLSGNRPASYDAGTDERLAQAIARLQLQLWVNRPGGIFLIPAARLQAGEEELLQAASRVVLDAGAGELGAWLERLLAQGRPQPLPPLAPSREEIPASTPLPLVEGLQLDNGLGAFSADGREYLIELPPGAHTPAPWCNVVANERVGSLISESGGGYSWCDNAGENRLTPWTNDPLLDPPGEVLYLRDEETTAVWSATPQPAPGPSAYRVCHGAGWTRFRNHGHGLEQELTLFVAPQDPIRFSWLRVKNATNRARRVTVTWFVEWVLGTDRAQEAPFLIPELDPGTQVMLARNPWPANGSGGVAFAAASRPLHGFTGDRTEFLGQPPQLDPPPALRRVGLSGAVRAGLDPCAALQVHLDLAPGEEQEVHFLLGQGADRASALALAERYRPGEQAAATLGASRQLWAERLEAVQVHTPEPSVDLLLNGWLPYQNLSSRILGRTGFYQSSGAFGFRDQLQDVAALLLTEPGRCRGHLLLCAARQFAEGDVLHWWHPPGARGLRSRCSDDLLWLPWATAEYVEATGDLEVLHELVPFLTGPALGPGEHERYGTYQEDGPQGSLLDHCLRALARAGTSGAHGLPLFGAGDWNDGMNRVGIAGRGESLWLGWFSAAVRARFAPLCEAAGDRDTAATLRAEVEALRQAIEQHGWDGSWYLRGWYDDGTPLGSHASEECRIDSLCQSWAALTGLADPARTARSIQAMREQLCDPQAGLVRLLSPPFDQTSKDPGYIKGYPPGIRENGGQYSHAAMWALSALARAGDPATAVDLFRRLSPATRSADPEEARLYRVEPYVMAGDIYATPPHVGRGGWTWYTGSAGWAWRFGIEEILGLRRSNGALRVDPNLPPDWPGYQATLRLGRSSWHIEVDNAAGEGRGVTRILVDGAPPAGGLISLEDDGVEHRVEITLGRGASRQPIAIAGGS